MARHRIGLIGLGKMGSSFLKHLLQNERYEVVSMYDVNEDKRRQAALLAPNVKLTDSADEVIADRSIEAVGLFTLADIRPQLMRQALASGKHILAEKPLGTSVLEEERLLADIEQSGRLVAVNLFNRTAWYHRAIQEYRAKGEIGELAIIRISHQTPGDLPIDESMMQVEGPPFHTCGMHYVDVARWYAGSEVKTYHAQGMRMWDWKDPWWVQVHGTFHNGIVFDITQGFTYGQLSKTKTNNSGIELVGTLGVVRMQHDFKEAVIEYYGVNNTRKQSGPYGGKNIEALCSVFADSLDQGENAGFPTARDSFIASKLSWEMLAQASGDNAPSIGTYADMERIAASRKAKS